MVAARTIQRELYRLWYKHYTREISQEERNQLAEDFISKWLDNCLKVQLYKPIYRHPALRRKERSDIAGVTIGEILSDFVLRANMDDERHAEFPVIHAEQELENADKRKENELNIRTKEIDKEKGERMPAGYIMLDDASNRQAYQPKPPVTVEQFHAELARVKRYAEFYADSFAEEYGKDRADALRRIKGLRLERVRECEICGGAFYARDMRRENCDQQHGIKSGGGRSELSACEHLYQAVYHAEYYLRNREKRPS